MAEKNEESSYPYHFKDGKETFFETGMTIRDVFAGNALQGIMATEKGIRLEPAAAAKMCYDFADKMMEERSK